MYRVWLLSAYTYKKNSEKDFYYHIIVKHICLYNNYAKYWAPLPWIHYIWIVRFMTIKFIRIFGHLLATGDILCVEQEAHNSYS